MHHICPENRDAIVGRVCKQARGALHPILRAMHPHLFQEGHTKKRHLHAYTVGDFKEINCYRFLNFLLSADPGGICSAFHRAEEGEKQEEFAKLRILSILAPITKLERILPECK
jgi:hypothetical protein